MEKYIFLIIYTFVSCHGCHPKVVMIESSKPIKTGDESYESTALLLEKCVLTNNYKLRIEFKRPSCTAYDNIQILDQSSARFLERIHKHIGPDEILVFIEGQSLEAFIPKYIGCNIYESHFSVSVTGKYYLKILLVRTKYSALNSNINTFPPVLNSVLIHEIISLESSINIASTIPDSNYSSSINTSITSATTYSDSSISPPTSDWKWRSIQSPFQFFDKPYTLKTSAENYARDLELSTYIQVSNKLKSEKFDQTCPDHMELYEWKGSMNPMGAIISRDNTLYKELSSSEPSRLAALKTPLLPFINKTTAAKILSHKFIHFYGDSHMCNLVELMIEWVCGTRFDGFLFDASHGAKGICEHFLLHIGRADKCETYAQSFIGAPKGNEYVINNCGHHPAGFNHWPPEKYATAINTLLEPMAKLGWTKKNYIWMESTAPMLRADKQVKQKKDWRTFHRIQLFNSIAHFHLKKYNFTSIIPTFYSTLAVSDKLCDNNHYISITTIMPHIQWLLHFLQNNPSNIQPMHDLNIGRCDSRLCAPKQKV